MLYYIKDHIFDIISALLLISGGIWKWITERKNDKRYLADRNSNRKLTIGEKNLLRSRIAAGYDDVIDPDE